jgi:glycosyl transferase family 25
MILNTYLDRIFVLNLPRSTERRRHIVRSFARLGIWNYEFVEAVDGSALDIDQLHRGGHVLRDDYKDRELTPGEIGCNFSHQKAWTTGRDRGFERFMVCEDDVAFSDDSDGVARRFLNEVPDDWDILHFHSNYAVGGGAGSDAGRRRITDTVHQGWNEGGGALCYALTSRGASRLIDLAYPMRYALDGVTNWLTGDWKECEGYTGYICSPFIARESGHKSTIGSRAN